MTRRGRVIGWTLALLFAGAVAQAKVYRIVGGAPGRLNTAGLPWEAAYSTTMNVNGRVNEVKLYSARYTEPVVEQLRAQLEAQGAKVVARRAPTGASGVAKWPDREARFLVLSPEHEPRHLIFMFYPDPAGATRPVRFPIPIYGGAEPENLVVDVDTKVYSATIKTFDSATAVHEFYRDRLTAEGWALFTPARVSEGGISGMAIYRRGKRTCYVQAVDRAGRPNVVTLLVNGSGL